MDKKMIKYVLPAAVLPYLAIATLALIFLAVEFPALGFIMEHIFFNNGLYLLAVTIFTYPFSIGVFLFDYYTLMLTGLLNIAAVINSVRKGIFTLKEVIWVIILQFVFCADVIASVWFFLKLRKQIIR